MAKNFIGKDWTFDESLYDNNATYIQYYRRLMELAIAMFEWKNLPDSIDERFLEMTLFTQGRILFFRDEELGELLALPCTDSGKWNIYNVPVRRRAFASNGYNASRTIDNSIICYNNYLRLPSSLDTKMFAKRLSNLDRSIDVNSDAQKTPVLIRCKDTQRLTLKNVYKEWKGNAPVIYATKDFDPNDLTVLRTDAPYVGDKLYELKTQIWNEALTYLGITNINVVKKERLITDEVKRNLGGVVASRYSRLESRRQACDKINKMFGTNIECNYREDFQTIMDETQDVTYNEESEDNE